MYITLTWARRDADEAMAVRGALWWDPGVRRSAAAVTTYGALLLLPPNGAARGRLNLPGGATCGVEFADSADLASA